MDPSLDARLEALYAAHARDVHRYLALRLPPADAEEVTADVFVVAWRKIDRLPPNQIAWLLGVARKLAANRRRALVRTDRLTAACRVASAGPVADHGDAIGEADLAARALARLRSRDQELICLLVTHELTDAELAYALGCTANPAAVRRHRARARLPDAFALEEQAVRDAARSRPEPPTFLPRLPAAERN